MDIPTNDFMLGVLNVYFSSGPFLFEFPPREYLD